MSVNDSKTELGHLIEAIEEGARAHDSGRVEAAEAIANALWALFQPQGTAPALLSRLGGTYTRLASSVPKPPHPQGVFLPLIDVSLQMQGYAGYVVQASTGPTGLSAAPRCQPRLGRVSTFRHVQAPDWWKSEGVFVVDHSRSTRRDVVESLRNPSGHATAPMLRLPLSYGATVEVAWLDAARAATRQIAHELLGSPEFVTLASGQRR